MKRLWNKNIRCTEARYESIHDQITDGLGSKSFTGGQSDSRTLFQQVFATPLYPATTVYHPSSAAVLQNRLSRHRANPLRFQRFTPGVGPKKGSRSLHPAKVRSTAPKKRAFENLLNGIFDQAQKQQRLCERPTGVVDATGLESRHTSQHYIKRLSQELVHMVRQPKC